MIVLAGAALTAARAAERGMHAGELAHELDRIRHTGRVLYLAAHPDDENTRLLAYVANARHLQAAYLAMTRGGGGQNLIGPEQGDLLDVIRTEELLSARRIDGALQRFTRMRDFGYSKTAAETLATWGHDDALADVVWVIRTFQPDVIITRFDENPPNHGHHTASAILAREAFEAAADPKRFPEQLGGGVQPWKCERLLRNHGSWREEPPKDALVLDVGAYDPRLGLGYGELAAVSRSQHRSQGFGVAGQRGPLNEYFVPVAGSRPQQDILDGVDVGWTRFGAPAAPFAKALDDAHAALDRDYPERAIPALVGAHAALDALPDVPRVRDARRSLERLIAACAGLFVRATAATPIGVPGGTVQIDVELVQGRPAGVELRRVVFPGVPPVEGGGALAVNERKTFSQPVPLPADVPVTLPYWLAVPGTPGRHAVSEPRLLGQPEGPPALAVQVELRAGGRDLALEVPVVHAWTDPVLGERERPFVIVPPVTVTPARDAVMLPGGRGGTLSLAVRAGRDDVRGELVLTPIPAGWDVTPPSRPFALAKAGDAAMVEFVVKAPSSGDPAVTIAPVATVDGRTWSFRETTIDYPHIPVQLVLQQPKVRLVPLSIRLPDGLIGYVQGSGDTVADDLAHVGLRVETLSDETLRAGDLDRFAAIVVGIRAYNTREAVRAAHPRLMDYVERGGTVVVQYNTNSRIGPMQAPVGPFPLEIGRDRVTDETAAIVPLKSDHPMLRVPNEIGPADFAGWVQERGIYFASRWDERYEPLFAIADPGEEPSNGSTLVARHGKGRYVYTGLAFFRQLPAGVPGAYRLFVNLLARP